jgi:hypothetical protein
LVTKSKTAKALLDKLPSTNPEEMVAGGWNTWIGKIRDVEAEEDAEYGYQLKITSETEDTRTGEMPVWLTFGKAYKTTGRVIAGSKGGLFLARVGELVGPFKWPDLIGKWMIWEREHVDFGNQGVHDVWLPVKISDTKLTKADYASLAAPDEDKGDSHASHASHHVFRGSDVRVALQLMDESTDKAFRKAVVKEEDLEDTGITDAVIDGTFQTKALEEGWIAQEDDGEAVLPYDVIDMPEEDAEIQV